MFIAAYADVPAGTFLAIARSVPARTRTATSRVARGGWKADKAHRSAAEECTGAPGLGTPGCSPAPVDYAIYGIIHSACGAHRKPAAVHRYVPPGCIRNGVTCSLIGMSGRSRTVSEVPGHRLGVPGVLYRWSSAVWDYASREASSPSALRVCSISGRIPNLARMMIVDWEPPSSRMRRTRFS